MPGVKHTVSPAVPNEIDGVLQEANNATLSATPLLSGRKTRG